MAAGRRFPELVTSIVGVFVDNSRESEIEISRVGGALDSYC